jgi:hypothetical protein
LSAWILIPVITLTLYAFWRVLDMTFSLIENYHASRREERFRAAEPRRTGAERTEEKVA